MYFWGQNLSDYNYFKFVCLDIEKSRLLSVLIIDFVEESCTLLQYLFKIKQENSLAQSHHDISHVFD